MSEQLLPSDLPWAVSALKAEEEANEEPSAEDTRAFTDLLNSSPDDMADVVEEMSTEQIVGHLRRAGKTIQQQEAKFASLQEISSAIGATIQLDELLALIMDKITGLMDAERSSLFLLDEETGELWSRVSQGVEEQEIRLDIGEGIAGWVAQTGKPVNIRDAYQDERFNPEYDRRTGFETESVLCQCVRNQEGEIIGVVQVLNADSGEFTKADEHLLSTIASQAAVAIENSRLYLSAIETNAELRETKHQLEQRVAELDLLYDVEQELSQAHNLEALIESVTKKTLEMIRAEASALLLKHGDHPRMYVLVDQQSGAIGDHEWEFSVRNVPAQDGIAARAIERGEPVLCGSGDCEPVPESSSETMGLPVQNAIAVPLFDEDECIGALKVANRLPSPDESRPGDVTGGFSEDDKKVLTLIAGQIAVAVSAQRHREEREKRRRLASIGQALSGVLHDLKNPAALISGYVQLMVKADDRETREEYAGLIDQQFEQFSQMTQELLTFARGESNVEIERVRLEEFADDIGKLLDEELTGRDIDLDIDLSLPDRDVVRIDAPKIKRALMNLARNAVEAMSEGGTLSIAADINDQGQLVLQVKDTGEGIPREIRDTLFDAFVTEGKRHGTGLGLAIVKKAIEDHGGTIDYHTELGEGTTFTITLPQREDELTEPTDPDEQPRAERQPA